MNLRDLEDSEVYILDFSSLVEVTNCTRCKIFIGKVAAGIASFMAVIVEACRLGPESASVSLLAWASQSCSLYVHTSLTLALATGPVDGSVILSGVSNSTIAVASQRFQVKASQDLDIGAQLDRLFHLMPEYQPQALASRHLQELTSRDCASSGPALLELHSAATLWTCPACSYSAGQAHAPPELRSERLGPHSRPLPMQASIAPPGQR